jgi:hypothetical protein
VALKPLKPNVPKAPSFRLGFKPIQGPTIKKPLQYKPPSVKPYVTPAAKDYGQDFLYGKGGYTGPRNPVDMSTFFPGGGGKQYSTQTGTYDQGASREQFTPLTDYGALISGDWEVQDAEAAMASQMSRGRGDFQAALRSQLIDLGLQDTSKLGSLGKYIDADTIKAAAANKYSATAQNQQVAERTHAMNNASLAARGMLSSGQTTKSAEDVIAAQEGAGYSALRNFLEGGAQGLSGLADMEYQMARGVASARAAAAQRAAMYGPGGDPTGFDQYGLSTDYSQTRDTGQATQNMLNQLAQQQLNRQIAAERAAAAKAPKYQAMGPYGPYGPAQYTAANRPYYGR